MRQNGRYFRNFCLKTSSQSNTCPSPSCLKLISVIRSSLRRLSAMWNLRHDIVNKMWKSGEHVLKYETFIFAYHCAFSARAFLQEPFLRAYWIRFAAVVLTRFGFAPSLSSKNCIFLCWSTYWNVRASSRKFGWHPFIRSTTFSVTNVLRLCLQR